jgi:hypothetical protein
MLSTEFIDEFLKANKRLTQKINVSDIEKALEFISTQPKNTCLSIQPGHSNYAWSERKVVMVFFWNTGSYVKIRFVKKISVRNSEIMPGTFPELRGFPKGNFIEKLLKWDQNEDGLKIDLKSIKIVHNLPEHFYNLESKEEGIVFYHLWHL